MKKDGKYRFSLQFSMDTEEEIIVGEFLERLGNKKSDFIVPIVSEYLSNHQELQLPVKIEMHRGPKVSIEKIEQIVRRIVDEKLNSGKIDSIEEGKCDGMQDDIAKMLGNLDLFL